jgi:16S rRNA (guanine966-N2)-methyltransferase
MRIIAGRFKGTRLLVPRGPGLRPTTDRVREALFSALGSVVNGSRILDLFAGTGAFGFEALSRGASSVVFVDPSRKALDALRRTVHELGVEAQTGILATTASRAIKILAESEDCFGIVYLDPPYETDWVQEILFDPAFRRIVDEQSLVVTERDAHRTAPSRPSMFVPFFSRRYGGTIVEMLRLDPDEP